MPEPDRTWMSLAAYNMGMGHLRDARILTQKQGRDPDKWSDVIQSLDLLSQEKWHSQTRYGYARGFEAKVFVENIRRYYEILVWMDTREHPLLVHQLASGFSDDLAFLVQPQALPGFFTDLRQPGLMQSQFFCTGCQ